MLPMCSLDVRARLIPVLERLQLPTEVSGELDRILEALAHDKKADGNDIAVVTVPQVGRFEIKKLPLGDYIQQVKGGFGA
jgi:3-dehydroquinate synthetase